MHYQLLKQLMRHHGLGVLLDDPVNGKHIREMLRSSVIFTDMGIHKDFMAQFKRLIDGEAGTINQRQTIICQALLKNADISNPVRPNFLPILKPIIDHFSPFRVDHFTFRHTGQKP